MTDAKANRVEVLDTTLRDGEQTPNVGYTPIEKMQLAKLLLEGVGVDRIEVASAAASPGEEEACRLITQWAGAQGYLDRVEILGFCDGERSATWVSTVGGRRINLLLKGSAKHCRGQLRMSPEQHRENARVAIAAARSKGIAVSTYLEDWSNGIQEDPKYVADLVNTLLEEGVERIYLPDTLGVLSPHQTEILVAEMTRRWPGTKFEFHGHNDYGLATANCLAAIAAGASGFHASVNGLGERAGNASLASTVAAIHDLTPRMTGVREAMLMEVSERVAAFSGKELALNTPVTGADVFTQTSGVHADGDAKGDLYANKLKPERFGRVRAYALGKLSGKASLTKNLDALGLEVPEHAHRLLLTRITELGDKKHVVEPADLPFLVSDVLHLPQAPQYKVASYDIVLSRGCPAVASLRLEHSGKSAEASATGVGGYDALMNALRSACKDFNKFLPELVDFRVQIPPGGNSEALVVTRITWGAKDGRSTFTTVGVDSDQLDAAVMATEKMLNRLGHD